jgi:hypothetical protein
MVMKARFKKFVGGITVGAAAVIFGFSATSASAQIIRVTEVMNNSGLGGTLDWFELTNYGSSSVSISNWRYDDNSFDFLKSALLEGVTTMSAGESVVFLEVDTALGAPTPAQQVTDFKNYWPTTAQVGYHSGAGLSSNGDGLVIFDSTGVEITPQTNFGSAVATVGQSFYWSYNPNGDFVLGTAGSGVVSNVGSIPGENGGISQTAFVSTSPVPAPFTSTNLGSPGSAAVVPEPSTIGLAAAGLGLAGLAARRRLRKA